MIHDRIKFLRELNKMTQAGLAKQLRITRSSVNAWEMGISVPSTQYIVELALLFHVSTDYLLGIESSSTINVSDLTNDEVKLLQYIATYLRKSKSNGK